MNGNVSIGLILCSQLLQSVFIYQVLSLVLIKGTIYVPKELPLGTIVCISKVWEVVPCFRVLLKKELVLLIKGSSRDILKRDHVCLSESHILSH